MYPPDGPLLGGTDAIKLKFDREHQTITGSWQLKLNYTMPNNAPADQCDSGQVTFKLTQ